MYKNRLTRLSEDGYKRPTKTIQDKLSKDEIKEKLSGYMEVKNIKDLSINDHIRYFTIKEDSTFGKIQQFRLGGNLIKIDKEGRYIVLSNGLKSWSVQLKTAILFKKTGESKEKNKSDKNDRKTMSDTMGEDISREKLKKKIVEYKNYIIELNEENDRIKKENEKLKYKLKEYVSKLKK